MSGKIPSILAASQAVVNPIGDPGYREARLRHDTPPPSFCQRLYS